jgi:hypothetical protein
MLVDENENFEMGAKFGLNVGPTNLRCQWFRVDRQCVECNLLTLHY